MMRRRSGRDFGVNLRALIGVTYTNGWFRGIEKIGLPIADGVDEIALAVTADATFAAIGLKKSLWFVVAALIGHGLFDIVHPHAIDNGGVPVWCVVAGILLLL